MMFTLAAATFFAGALLALTIAAATAGRRPLSSEPVPDRQEMRHHLLYGLFYCNPNDPRGWVPEATGYGWTVNLRSRAWVLVFLALLVGLVFVPTLIHFVSHQ